ncbi:MAG: flagellar assembly protein FliH [Pseudomonadota bacterium]
MTRTQSSRFIPDEQIHTAIGWDFDAVDQASVRFAAKVKAREEAEEKVRDNEARQIGFADGYAQGHAQATLEGQRLITEYIQTQGQDAARHYAQLFESANAQIAESHQVMAKGVLELACELARQVLRHELSTNPNALQPVIREALSVLATDCKAALVRLNPLDLDVLEDALRQEFAGLSLSLLADTNVTRGGCLVESTGTVVDGTIEKRWGRSVARLGLESSWEVPHDGD